MLATHQAINVEFTHLHLNGLQFLDLFLILMDQTSHCGMLIMTIAHLSQISHLSEDGQLLGLNNTLEMLLYAQWVLIRIMLLTLEISNLSNLINLINFIKVHLVKINLIESQ